MPFFILADEFQIFTGNLPLWQSLLVLFLMSPVVLSIVNGLMLWQQNKQRKSLSELEAQQAENRSEQKQQEILIASVNETNQQLLKLIRESLLSGEKRDERYIAALKNLDSTVGGFGNILQQDNHERHGIFDAIRVSLEKQTEVLDSNKEAMNRFTQSQDHAVQVMEQTSQSTHKGMEEIKAAFQQLSGKIETWGQLFQSAVGASLKTTDELGHLRTSIDDMLGLIQTEIGKVLSAVESKDDNAGRLDKENIL